MLKTLAAVVVALLALSAAGCTGVTITVNRADAGAGQAGAVNTPTLPVAIFATPEAAITHYLEGVTENDTGKILEACAIDEMSEGYQADLFVERLGGVMIPQTMPAPADYPFYGAINQAQQTNRILSQVKNFAFALLSAEDIAAGIPIQGMDAERVRKFITDIDPARLATIDIKSISPPPVPAASETRYLENTAQIARIYGADEYTERVVIFAFEGSDYYMGFQLLRYGDHWKIMDQSSPLGNTNVMGIPTRQ